MQEQDFSKFSQTSLKVVADKARTPEDTVAMVEAKLKSLGARVYKGLKRIDKGRLGIPVYLSLYDVEGIRTTGNYKQMGKGVTEILSKASALMELVERFSLFSYVRRVPEIGILATFEELAEKAIPWEVFISSLEDEEEKRIKEYALRLLRRAPLYFIPSFEVRTGKTRYLPFYWFWMLYEYNGSAGGNTYPEATVQAMCELIERHVNALSIRTNKSMPAIDVENLSGETRTLIYLYERLGIKLWVRDMTFGMPAPTVAVLAMDPSTYPERSELVYAAGTGTSPERALIRALTEVAQLAGDFDTEGRYVESGLPKFRNLDEARTVIEFDGEISLGSLPNIYSEDHVKELLALSQGLKERGFEPYLVDIAHQELSLPAVYTIIPGILFRERTRIPFLFHLARVSYFYHPREIAKRLLEEALAEVKDRYYLWGLYGNLLKDAGDLESAATCYERSLGLEPPPLERFAILTHLADTYLNQGNFVKAIQTCEFALELNEASEVYNLLGRAYYRLGDFGMALESFLKATELNPASAVDFANAGFSLKSVAERAEDIESKVFFLNQAKVFFLKALALDPELEMAKRGLTQCELMVQEQN